MTTEPTGAEPALGQPHIPAPRGASEPVAARQSVTGGTPSLAGAPSGDATGAPGGDGAGAPSVADAADGDAADRDTADAAAGTDLAAGRNWPVVLGTIIMVVLGIGWALLSRFAFHDGVTDAVAEGIGAALGLLIAVSVIGAIVSARKHRDRAAGS